MENKIIQIQIKSVLLKSMRVKKILDISKNYYFWDKEGFDIGQFFLNEIIQI